MVATRSEEPVVPGAAILGAVAGGDFADIPEAMRAMSSVKTAFEPA